MTEQILLYGAIGALVLWNFKEQIKLVLHKVRVRFLSSSRVSLESLELFLFNMSKEIRYADTLSTAELNHIKGQLQEVLQNQKLTGSEAARIIQVSNDVEALHTRLTALQEQINSLKTQDNEENSGIYIQGLASLTNASNKLLERQAAIENHLLEVVSVLKKLT